MYAHYRLIQFGEVAGEEKQEATNGSLTNLLQAVDKELAKTGEHITTILMQEQVTISSQRVN